MANQVILDSDGFIRQIYFGDQDATTISQTIDQSMVIIHKLQEADPNTPINILVDLHSMGGQNLSARQTGKKAIDTLTYHKIALFGANRFIRQTTNLVLLASRQQSKVKQFKSEAAATTWLKKK